MWLELDGIEAKYPDNFFRLWQGHTVNVEIILEEDISMEEIKKRLKVRSLNDTYV